jgi:hypothetical protein
MVRGMIKALENGHPYLINKSRKIGATWLGLYLIYHAWRFEHAFSAKVGSRKESLVDDGTIDSLFGKIRYVHERQPAHLREKGITDNFLKQVNHRNRSEILGEATNEGFGRGGRRTVILLDEFAHVPPRIGVATWLSIQSAWKTVWLTSTPNGKGNKFYELWASLPQHCLFQTNWRADPYRSDDFPSEKIIPRGELTPEEFEQEYNCSFTAVRTGRIWACQRDCIEFDEYDDDWVAIKDTKHKRWHIAGWDFGSGPSSLVCIMGTIETQTRDSMPRIWIDHELVWKSTQWSTAANDVLQRLMDYSPNFKVHFGDPAGINRESDQHSWETNLKSAGIPLVCLDSWHNSREGIDWQIKHVQYLFDSAKIRIHSRCRALWDAIEQWRYDIPDGVPMELVSKQWVAPRKDETSHPANALMYLVGGFYKSFRFLGKKKKEGNMDLPSSPAGQIRSALSNSYGRMDSFDLQEEMPWRR